MNGVRAVNREHGGNTHYWRQLLILEITNSVFVCNYRYYFSMDRLNKMLVGTTTLNHTIFPQTTILCHLTDIMKIVTVYISTSVKLSYILTGQSWNDWLKKLTRLCFWSGEGEGGFPHPNTNMVGWPQVIVQWTFLISKALPKDALVTWI